MLPLTGGGALPVDVPFSIALTQDDYDPWTKTSHIFRFYDQPVIDSAYPSSMEVGRIGDVYIKVASGSEFFEPLSIQPSGEKGTQSMSSGTGMSGMRCKFGRFGEAAAIYINETFIKCTTPPFDEGADTVSSESAPITVAMNGVDFMDDSYASFTMTGSAAMISFITIIVLLAAIAFFAYAFKMYLDKKNAGNAEG